MDWWKIFLGVLLVLLVIGLLSYGLVKVAAIIGILIAIWFVWILFSY